MISVLVSLAVVGIALVAVDWMMSMPSMRSYSRQAAIVTEQRKKHTLP